MPLRSNYAPEDRLMEAPVGRSSSLKPLPGFQTNRLPEPHGDGKGGWVLVL